MIRVTINRYIHDNRQYDEILNFPSLEAFYNHIKRNTDYSRYNPQFFANPKVNHFINGKLKLDSSCISWKDSTYINGVVLIENEYGIIYSTGKYTNNISHWSEEVQCWLLKIREEGVKFNFVK